MLHTNFKHTLNELTPQMNHDLFTNSSNHCSILMTNVSGDIEVLISSHHKCSFSHGNIEDI